MLQNMDSRACLPIRPACPHEPEHLTLVIDFCKKWWTRIATKEMAFIGIVTLAASLVASWLKQFPGFSLFGALIIALLIGMVAQFPIRKWYSSRSAEHKAGVKDAAGLISNKLLRLGIILLGFKLNLTVLFTQGIKCLPIAAVVVTLTIVVCYNIARKLGVDPQLAILVAGGTGICGAAAVMGLSGSIKVPPEKEDEKANNEVMAVAIIAIMGTIFALLEIALGPLTGLSKTQLGITAGASLHEIAHAVAAGDAFGAVGIATIMKLSRVLMLVFAAIIIAVWWDKNHSEMPADGKRKVSFPWFMLGFIGKDFDAIALMLAEFVWCALLFGAGAVLTEGGPSMAWARWDIVLCIAYLVIGSTVIAQVFQTIAIQNLPTSEASVILSTECIFAMLVSVIFTGETLTVPSLCGFALIFGAILLSEIQLPSAKRQRGTTEGD